MLRTRIVSLLCALGCLLGLTGSAMALEVDCDTAYCFTAGDFGGEKLAGICITGLPEAEAGTAMLGSRVLRAGDILTADQVAAMTFVPLQTQTDREAVMTYLPIYSDRVEKTAEMTISIRGREDAPPVAEDSALETYKNIPVEGKLKASDPREEALTYSLVRQPKRGEVELRPDGSFTYTPKKNKVGVDSFTYTAADPAGNLSREATVTVTILKPTDAPQYQDTAGKSCQFAAEWMKNTGIFVAEQVGGASCFQPEKPVTQGEFLTMLTRALGIQPEEQVQTLGEDTPDWLKPYLAAAIRSGLTDGLPAVETFGSETAITGAEAALLLQNALNLPVPAMAAETAVTEEPSKQTLADLEAMAEAAAVPVWAETALSAMAEQGMTLEANAPLNRGQAAQILYQAHCMVSAEEIDLKR